MLLGRHVRGAHHPRRHHNLDGQRRHHEQQVRLGVLPFAANAAHRDRAVQRFGGPYPDKNGHIEREFDDDDILNKKMMPFDQDPALLARPALLAARR